MSDMHDAEVWKLQAEIERLRLENEKLAAAMSSDGADACSALVVAEAELEQLRALLEIAPRFMSRAHQEYWEKKLREMLSSPLGD